MTYQIDKNAVGNVISLRFAADDWHVHLRDVIDGRLQMAAPYTARQFNRALIMPNLSPPVCTMIQAIEYRNRIRIYTSPSFEPLMTAYLTDNTDAADLIAGYESGGFTAAKLYPANATTGSAHGVTDILALMPIFERMQKAGMPLCIHAEVTDHDVDIFDREAVFIERTLIPLLKAVPELKVVFEHMTTQEAVEFVTAAGSNVAATITQHHLHINRNAMLVGGVRPHAYCLPVAKRERHRLALRAAVVSGNPKFFLGTDSAPHEVRTKENACGCAGIFNAPYALESYATVFDEEDAIEKLPDFAGKFGAEFYGLSLPTRQVRLIRATQEVPSFISYQKGDEEQRVVPFHAGEILGWRLVA